MHSSSPLSQRSIDNPAGCGPPPHAPYTWMTIVFYKQVVFHFRDDFKECTVTPTWKRLGAFKKRLG